jgi:hypothetical protein
MVICLGQLLASKIHNRFNLRNQITIENHSPLDFYLTAHVESTPPYTTPNLARNFLSDQLRIPLL